jgi:large subunit ribosomal protein L4
VVALKKYDLTGKEVGTAEIADAFLEKKLAPDQLIKDYLVALMANQRQWSANTKSRKEVNKTGKKAQQQKGLGRARHGALSAPQFRKGGVVHGPKAKFDQQVKVNRKARRMVVRTLIAQKLQNDLAVVLKTADLKTPKTKKAVLFFEKLDWLETKVLVLGSLKAKSENLVKSLRNLPKKNFVYLPKVNGYELADCQKLVVLDSALEELTAILGK